MRLKTQLDVETIAARGNFLHDGQMGNNVDKICKRQLVELFVLNSYMFYTASHFFNITYIYIS